MYGALGWTGDDSLQLKAHGACLFWSCDVAAHMLSCVVWGGVCSAACAQADVMGVVHVGWATLDKRVREFSANAAAGLTVKEFEAAAETAEKEQEALLAALVSVCVCGGGWGVPWGLGLQGLVGGSTTEGWAGVAGSHSLFGRF